jgi:23S rRNA pseudouridine1911/1915/1917 synthase
MNEQFRNQEINKIYWAIVENSPEKSFGTLKNKLQKNEKKNKSFVTKKENGKNAILDYKLLKRLDNFFLLEIKPKTGRHHQIRVQLSNIGCIIKGDLKYGAKRSNTDASISLIAKQITFIHPVRKEEINITAPCPKTNIWNACN